MFGDRLKLARKKAGLSLRDLSNELNGEVTAQAIGKYERGEMMPSSGILLHLAKTLGVSVEFLLSERVEELESVQFSRTSGTTAGDRARVEATVIDHLQRYLAVEDILELNRGVWKAPRHGNRWLGEESAGEQLAQDLRKEWRLGVDPIPNMTSLLEDRGIKVLLLPLPSGISGLTAMVRQSRRQTKLPVIVVNKDITLERRRLTLAHELAHRLIDQESLVDHEKASNIFAGAFLVSSDHLVREIGTRRKALGYQELIQLKRMYRVSAAALLVRMEQIGVIDQSALDYAFQTFARHWRSIEPEPLESQGEKGRSEIPRRFERLCYWALAEKFISPTKASELLQQSLSEIKIGLKGPSEGNANSGQ